MGMMEKLAYFALLNRVLLAKTEQAPIQPDPAGFTLSGRP